MREPELRDASGKLLGRMLTLADYQRAVPVPHYWGGWSLDTDVLVLRTRRIPGGYEVDLERCLDSAQVLDWIFQVHSHLGPGNEIPLAGLIRALRDVLNPQHNLCSGAGMAAEVIGAPREITKDQVRELAVQAQDRREDGIAIYGEWWSEGEPVP